MKIKIPSYVNKIIDALNLHGFRAFVVGGCVRDSLLGIKPYDWDVTTNCPPEKTAEIFKRTKLTGAKHGTVLVFTNKYTVEVTSFRIDGDYSNGRHPDSVIFTDDLRQDLTRRDFTINALAYNDDDGIIDYFGGINDLNNRKIKCVNDADKRFTEDYLRILRAFRFAAKLNFEIEENTLKAALKYKSCLNEISAERIQKELDGILLHSNYEQLHFFLSEFSEILIPQLWKCKGITQKNEHHCYDVFEHIVHSVVNYTGDDLTVKLALLLHDTGKYNCKTITEDGIEQFKGHPDFSFDISVDVLANLNYPKVLRRNVQQLILFHHYIVRPNEIEMKKMLNKFGTLQTKRLLEVKTADIKSLDPKDEHMLWVREVEQCKKIVNKIIQQKQVFELKDLAINGADIKDNCIIASRKIGKLLKLLLDKVINNKCENEKEALLELAKKEIAKKRQRQMK